MTESGETEATPSPESAVVVLTRELSNYSERIAEVLRCPISELWGIFLAVTGRMSYVVTPGDAAITSLGVVDSHLADGSTRFQTWERSLDEVLRILGDPEARYRTGYDTAVLRDAMKTFFGSVR